MDTPGEHRDRLTHDEHGRKRTHTNNRPPGLTLLAQVHVGGRVLIEMSSRAVPVVILIDVQGGLGCFEAVGAGYAAVCRDCVTASFEAADEHSEALLGVFCKLQGECDEVGQQRVANLRFGAIVKSIWQMVVVREFSAKV